MEQNNEIRAQATNQIQGVFAQPRVSLSMAAIVMDATLPLADLDMMRRSLVVHPVGGLLVLLTATVLSVYKPWGMTPYGLRMQNEELAAWRPTSGRQLAPWGRYVLFGIIAVVLLVLLLHLAGIGLHAH